MSPCHPKFWPRGVSPRFSASPPSRLSLRTLPFEASSRALSAALRLGLRPWTERPPTWAAATARSAGDGAPPVTSAPAIRLAVAVGAQELKVLQAVVEPITVDVVKLHAKRRSPPALLAPILLEPLGDQPVAKVESGAPPAAHKPLVERGGGRANVKVSAKAGVVPTRLRATEALTTLSRRVPFVIELLDVRPIITARESRINGTTKGTGVVRDRRLRQAELSSDFGLPQTLVEQALDEHTRSHIPMFP